MLYLGDAPSGVGLLGIRLWRACSAPSGPTAGGAMGTIVESAGKHGTTGYHARIVVKRDGTVHRGARTVDRRARRGSKRAVNQDQ